MGRRRKKRASSLSDSSELDLLQIFGVPTSNDFDDVLGIIPVSPTSTMSNLKLSAFDSQQENIVDFLDL